MFKPTTLLLGWMGMCSIALSQESQLSNSVKLIASPDAVHHRVPAPAILAPGDRVTTISVNYNGFSAEAQTAFQYAVDIWESILDTDETILVNATWTSLEPNVLGSAGASTLYRDFSNAPESSVWYPVALANHYAGDDLNGADQEINASFNSDFGNWYLGTDGNCPSGQYDFVTVVLHEIGHGLGFFGSASVDDAGSGSITNGGYPYIYDLFAQLGTVSGVGSILNYEGLPEALGNALTGDQMHWNGPIAVSFNDGDVVDLYAPDPWNGGSSYSHLSESTFNGTPDALMTPQLGTGEAIHNPGNIGLGMLQDMGWSVACEQWYLPDAVEGGPAIYACFAPDGYTLAANQVCASDIIASDSYCVANTWDQICQDAYDCCLAPVEGCTSIVACNYDPNACIDDGSCIGLCFDSNCFRIEMSDSYGDGWNGASWSLSNVEGTLGYVGGGLADGESGVQGACMGDGCYLFQVTEGAWPSEIGWTIYGVDGGPISGGAGESFVVTFNSELGCTDSQACNYNEDACGDDGSCTFPGCQDAMACNYDALAGCEGPCDYPPAYIEGCTNPMSSNYSPIATVDDGSCDLSYMCGEGTVYDEVLGICVTNECVGDFNGDGSIGAADLLNFLAFYGTDCD